MFNSEVALSGLVKKARPSSCLNDLKMNQEAQGLKSFLQVHVLKVKGHMNKLLRWAFVLYVSHSLVTMTASSN